MENLLAIQAIQQLKICSSTLQKIITVTIGSILIALLAQLRIPLPFTPVPITGQTLGVLLVAGVLGSRLGIASLGLYLLSGLAGLPVFTGWGFGMAHLVSPTGGYLVGFIAAAYTVGLLAEHGWSRQWLRVTGMFIIGEFIIYLFGITYLATFVGLQNALIQGVWPFLIGDLLKAALAAGLLPTAWHFIRK